MLHLVILFIFGACIGSFLNVCIYRLPRGESIIVPPSHCPGCNHKLSVVDLIPIFGYIILRGKCKYCGAPFSWRYPLVEVLTASLFLIAAFVFPPAINLLPFVFSLGFISLLMVVFFTDLEHQIIPDLVSYSGIVLGLVFNLMRGQIMASLSGAVLGYAILYLIGWLGKLAFKKEAMGAGDLYLAAFLGAFLGWPGLLVSVFLAYLLAGLVCFMLLLFKKVKLGEYIAFGPALVVGGLITLFFGQQIINWYLNLLL